MIKNFMFISIIFLYKMLILIDVSLYISIIHSLHSRNEN